jgi:hypothetical protein
LNRLGYSHEFFSDERYQNLLNKNKESNKDNIKDKFPSASNNSNEKYKYKSTNINTKNKNNENNFYGKFKIYIYSLIN